MRIGSLISALLATTIISGAHAQSPPAVASAAGFNTLTYGPNTTLGTVPDSATSYPSVNKPTGTTTTWYPFSFFGTSWTALGVSQNANGSIDNNGAGQIYGNGISTGVQGPYSPTQTSRTNITGQSFGGGGYFEVTMALTGPTTYWANDIETMNGASNGAGIITWPGVAPPQPGCQTTNNCYEYGIETDIAEMDVTNFYAWAFHNWYGVASANDVTTIGVEFGGPIQNTGGCGHGAQGPFTAPPGVDYTKQNKYAALWIPATSTTSGSMQYYFNGNPVGNKFTWNQYNSASPPSPPPTVGALTGGVANTCEGYITGGTYGPGTAWSVIDTRHLAFIIGTNPGSTSNVSSFVAWQKDGTQDIPAIAAGSGSLTSPTTLATSVGVSAPVTGLVAADMANPNDTMSFTGTAGGQGTLSATGATGNRTGTVTFTGSLTALNSVLAGMSFLDNTAESVTINWNFTDTHSGSFSASTAATVIGAVSPNCTTVTTVGPTITSQGPPAATWAITSGGLVSYNGAAISGTANVIELAYVNGVVWQKNSAGNWYNFNASGAFGGTGPTTTDPTSGCGNPSACVPSASGTVLAAGTGATLTDSLGQGWGLPKSGGEVFLQGTSLAATSNATELAYVNGTVWYLNGGGQWFSFNSSGGIASGPTTVSPLSNFTVSGGYAHDPTGAKFQPVGTGVYDFDASDQIGTLIAIQDGTGFPLKNLFPGINYLRVFVFPTLNNTCGTTCATGQGFAFPAVSAYATIAGYCLSAKIACEFEDHSSNGGVWEPGIAGNQSGQPSYTPTGVYLASNLAFWASMANQFKNNPYVWFGSFNEPNTGDGSLSKSAIAAIGTYQLAFYNNIRNQGANNIIDLSSSTADPNEGVGGPNGGLTVANFSGMTNIIYYFHTYNDSNTAAQIQAALTGNTTSPSDGGSGCMVSQVCAQSIQSKDGVVPVIVNEWGPSSDPNPNDTSGQPIATAMTNMLPLGLGNAGFLYWDPNGSNLYNMVNNGGTKGLTIGPGANQYNLTTWGKIVAAVMAANPFPGGGGGGGPVMTAPSTLAATQSTSTSVTGLSAADASWPNDTMSFTATSTGSGKLSATGATGNGSSSITFSGSLATLNTLLGTVTFTDAAIENPTIGWSFTDQHSLIGSASTAATVTGSVSSNCTVITTVGPTITSAGPPITVWSISSGAQIIANGTVQAGTSNVVKVAYVNGLFWQENSSNNWYSTTSSQVGYSGPFTTDPTAGCGSSPTTTVIAVPPPAAAVGYNTQVLGPNVSVGVNWFPYFQGSSGASITTNGDGSVTLAGGNNTSSAQITTIQAASGPTSYTGTVFANGAYFEMVASIGGSSISLTNGHPKFWAQDIETRANNTVNSSNQWQGQATGYGNWPEADIAEWDQSGSSTAFSDHVINFYDTIGSPLNVTASHVVTTSNINFTQPHRYGMLWVPATVSAQGYAKWYLDGVLTNTKSWNQYNPATAPPPVDGTTAYGVMDSRHMFPILGSGPNNPLTVYSMTAWQAGGTAQVQVPAPLTGTITTNNWQNFDVPFPNLTLPCGKPPHFNLALPPQYNGATNKYPLYIWLHPDYDGTPWYNGSDTNPQRLIGVEGGSYNQPAWMTTYPAIYVIPYADQSNGNGSLNSCTLGGQGSDAIINWGGWFHNGGSPGSGTLSTGDTGPNTWFLLDLVYWAATHYSVDLNRVYVNGFSLGSIGGSYLAQHYNNINGSPPLIAAELESGGGVDEADTPVNSATGTTMTSVPTWRFSGANDTASPPGDYNTPLCNSELGGPPASIGSITSVTANQCGTSSMHYTLCPSCGHQETDANGNNVWTNGAMNNYAFSIGQSGSPSPMTMVAPAALTAAPSTRTAIPGVAVTDTANPSDTMSFVGMSTGAGTLFASSAASFTDNFSTLSLHSPWQAGDNWQLVTPGNLIGQGGPNYGEHGDQWWVNPFNTNTPISGIYSVDSGGLKLGLINTPSAYQSYINTQAGTTLPYVGGLLNSYPTSYQKYGTWSITASVPAVAGFTFQMDVENVQITGQFPPEIDLRISTDGSGVETVLYEVSVYPNGYLQWTTTSASGFDITQSHVYSWDYESDFITFYIDNVQVTKIATPTGLNYTSNPVFMYLLTAANYIGNGDPSPSALPAYAHVSNVTVTPSGSGSLTGNGTGTIKWTGSLASLNTLLATLTFLDNTVPDNPTLTFQTTDQHSLSASAQTLVTIKVPPVATMTAPATLTVNVNTVTSVPGLVAADPQNASDTMSFTATSTSSGKLSGSGATGNGTGTISFSGGLTALNTMLGTVTFQDAITENPSISWSFSDQHSLTASASTAVAVTAPVSPNCTSVKTVGPTIVQAGPPIATYAIASDGKVSYNGAEISGTSNVVQLAYVNGVVWQANSSGNWYNFTPQGTYGGVVTTVSPLAGCASLPITVSAPLSANAVFGVTTPIPGVSASDPSNPSDVMSATITSSGAALVYATGATGTGTQRLTFSGSLTATNNLLASISVVSPAPVICFAGTVCSFSDSAGASWSISSSATVLRNGAAAGFSSNVALIALVSGVVQVWQENTANQWYFWNGTTWIAGTNPIGLTASATVVFGTGQSFTDGSGNIWTISVGGEALMNGSAPVFSANVAQLNLVNGTVWQLNASNQWYSWSGTAWVPGANPLGESQPSVLTYIVSDQHGLTGSAITNLVAVLGQSSPNYTVTKSVGIPISDFSGEQFALTSGAQVSVNGVNDATTSSVVELAWVNGNMWYENSSNNWWFKPNSSVPWTGPTKISPINPVKRATKR